MSENTEKRAGKKSLTTGMIIVLLAGGVLAAVSCRDNREDDRKPGLSRKSTTTKAHQDSCKDAHKPERVFKDLEHIGETSPLAIAGGVAYFAADDKLYAVNLKTGKVKWKQNAEFASSWSKPFVTDELVCFGLEGNGYYLYVLDIKSGEIRWQRLVGRFVIGPLTLACEKGIIYTIVWRIYAPGQDIVGLDIRTGKEVWRLKLEKRLYYWHSPIVADGTVYLSLTDWDKDQIRLYAVDIQSRSPRWKASSINDDAAILTPAAGNGIVIFAACGDGKVVLHAFRPSDWTELWNYETTLVWKTLPTIADGKVYIFSGDGQLYALDAKTGKVAWKAESSRYMRFSPIVADGKVFHATGDDYLRVLKADTGELLWKVRIAGVRYSQIAVVEGKVFVKDDEGILAIPLH